MAKKALSITTTDGTCPAGLFTPDTPVKTENQRGILLYMDVWGPRPSVDDMAQSIADGGYTVLVPDMFYRHGHYGPLFAREASKDETVRAAAFTRMNETTTQMTVSDAHAYFDCFVDHGVTLPIGITGYCQGGPHALETAMAFPDRVAAIASIHGAHLAPSDAIAKARAEGLKNCRLYIGSAEQDAVFPPEESSRMELAMRNAGVSYMMENVVGAKHGWSMTDAAAYNPAASALQLKRQLMVYDETFAQA